jgi:lyso-ornithine lipid O-acyltransferase
MEWRPRHPNEPPLRHRAAPLPALRPGMTKAGPSALRRAQRSIRFQRFGAAKGLAGVAATASLVLPAELMLRTVAGRDKAHLRVLFHRGLARSLGIRIVCHGLPVRQRSVLFIANHVSWADIPVLGARIRAAFVAKADVAGWGMVGWFADLARTVYVERERPRSAGEQRDAIAERLARGESVILFPEGTNGDGTHVLPFKSSLFAVTDTLPDTLVQPVTIAYTRVNGMPVTRERLPDLAWIGDTELMPHAMAFMALGRVRAEIIFHPAVRAADVGGRKALARHCETVIGDGYRTLMRG